MYLVQLRIARNQQHANQTVVTNNNSVQTNDDGNSNLTICNLCQGNHFTTSCSLLHHSNHNISNFESNPDNNNSDVLPHQWASPAMVSTSTYDNTQTNDNNTYQIINIPSNVQLFQNNMANFNDRTNMIISDSGASRCMFSNRMYFTNTLTVWVFLVSLVLLVCMKSQLQCKTFMVLNCIVLCT
jgi:hypothetical protein